MTELTVKDCIRSVRLCRQHVTKLLSDGGEIRSHPWWMSNKMQNLHCSFDHCQSTALNLGTCGYMGAYEVSTIIHPQKCKTCGELVMPALMPEKLPLCSDCIR